MSRTSLAVFGLITQHGWGGKTDFSAFLCLYMPCRKDFFVEVLFYIIAKVVEIYLSVVSLAMLLRVVLQFFVDVETNKIFMLCVLVSETFVFPFRGIMAKFNLFTDTPIDMPFMIAYLAVVAITTFLPII